MSGDSIINGMFWRLEYWYQPEELLPLPKPELPELPLPLPAILYGSSSGMGIRGRFLISSGRCTKRKKFEKKYVYYENIVNGAIFLVFKYLLMSHLTGVCYVCV